MKISKAILFSAATLLGGFCAVPAEATTISVSDEQTINVNSSLTENYYVSDEGKLTLNVSNTYTIYGHFYGSSSMTDAGAGTAETLGEDYSGGNGYYDIAEDGGEIIITGGGTLEYQGFSDISYYSQTIQTTHGQTAAEYGAGYSTSLVGISSSTGLVDTATTAFSGTLTVSGGTTLVVSGYLSQYVGYYRPQENLSTAADAYPRQNNLGYVGISNLNLKDTAVLSFASSTKNLLSEEFTLGDTETGSNTGATAVRALNFLNNVKADVNTTIVLGNDAASASRIIINTADEDNSYGWDGKTTIGKLAGTGRVYFVGDGTVSITNRAEFGTLNADASAVTTLELNVSNETSVLNYVKNLSATYNLTGHLKTTDENGDAALVSSAIADVFLTAGTVVLGSADSGTTVCDNVLETASAVQLAAQYAEGIYSTGYSHYQQINASLWESRPRYVEYDSASADTVEIYGTQILNNLQSLFKERQTLEDEKSNGGDGYFEITYAGGAYGAYDTDVVVRSGSALIINQEENRGGYFIGEFYTSDADNLSASSAANDGYIIKTGAGTFVNISLGTSNAVINRLFVYDGMWVADAPSIGAGRVTVGTSGDLLLVVNNTQTLSARLDGVGNITIARSTAYYDEEEGVWHSYLVNDDREYIAYTGTLVTSTSNDDWSGYGKAGSIQILRAMDNFYGTITVNDGLELVLGNAGNSELDSTFTNAAGITLSGSARLVVNSYQILPSLSAESSTSQLIFSGSNYDSVAVFTGAVNFSGMISGTGSLVKAGTQGLTLSSASGHSLATVGMAGSIGLDAEGAIRASSGVVLLNNSTISSSKNQKFASLIGSKSSVVRMSGNTTLTVGMTQGEAGLLANSVSQYYTAGGSKILYDAYYFATADKSLYIDSANGLNLTGINKFSSSAAYAALENLGLNHPTHMDDSGALSDFTVEDTIAYLKDPAKFENTFAHVYATIDSETWAAITASDVWQESGSSAGTLKATFDSLLDLTKVREFVNSAPAGWSQRELDDLLSFAESYSASSLFSIEDSQVTLSRAAYTSLVDANVIKYMNETMKLGVGVPETLYDFIALFVDDYKFRLTDTNVAILSSIYGFDTEAIRLATTSDAKYAEFLKLIGLSYDSDEDELPGYAGTIRGEVSLRKVGSETLRLTGVNSYSGSTFIDGGELRVDWDAIQATNAVSIASGAILTVVSEEVSEDDAEEDAKNIFKIADGAVIYGAGTLLKDGAGTLVIDAALGKNSSTDFTGEIIVGTGALVINIDDRESFAESVNVYLNGQTEFALNVADEEHTLTFKGGVYGGAFDSSDSAATKSYFTKQGAGTLVVENGVAFSDSGNGFDVKVDAGTLRVKFSADCTFRDGEEDFAAVLGSDAKLIFDVDADKTTTFAGLVKNQSGASGTLFAKEGAGTLVLARSSSADEAWSVNELQLNAGTLEIQAGCEYSFDKITTAEGTTFAINGSLLLDIEAGESDADNNVFNGSISGSGKIVKDGAGTLSLTNIDSTFKGTILLKAGTLVIDTETDKTLAFEIDTEIAEGTSAYFAKTGAGAVSFTNDIDFGGVCLSVYEGSLTVDGSRLATTDAAPQSLFIDEDAAFEIAPAATMNLGNIAGGISGKGTLAFGDADSSVSVSASADSVEAFAGTVSVGKNVSLNLAEEISSTSFGIAGAGTVNFATSETNIAIRADYDAVFSGTLAASTSDTTLTVSGAGTFDISDATLSNISGICVDGGDVALKSTATTEVTLDNGTLTVVDGTTYAGNVAVAGTNAEIGISVTGTLEIDSSSALENKTDSATVNTLLAAENVAQLTVANTVNKDLTIALKSGDSVALAAESSSETVADFTTSGLALATNSGGTLTLDTRALADKTAEYAGTISGDGDFAKSGAGKLRLSAASQTYTGKTTVRAGTLEFANTPTLATSGISVENGATLIGGFTLTAESANVHFAQGSTYELHISAGETIRYTGELTISGTLTLNIRAEQLSRGTSLPIFEYVGSDTATAIETDRFSIGNAMFYIDPASLGTGTLKVYVAQENFRDVDADYHDGVEELLDVLSVWAKPEGGYLSAETNADPKKYAIANALNTTSLGALGAEITKLSPLGFASMVAMPHSGFTADSRAISERLEQRLYDASSAIWVYAQDCEFFAQATGTHVDNGDDSDAATFDFDTYGALVGTDIKFEGTTLGFALAYDHGKAKLHDSGGHVESDNARATAFAGFLLNEYLALNLGAQFGYSQFDTKRRTLVGTNKGDTEAWHSGVFMELVGAYVLGTWGETSRLDLLPHVGVAVSYYSIDSFDEKGSASALENNSFDALSVQGSIGASLNYVCDFDGRALRFGVDFSVNHEFVDDEVDITAKLAGEEFKTEARALSGTTFSVAPSISFDVADKATVYLGYECRVGSESEVAHRANLGFRRRF